MEIPSLFVSAKLGGDSEAEVGALQLDEAQEEEGHCIPVDPWMNWI